MPDLRARILAIAPHLWPSVSHRAEWERLLRDAAAELRAEVQRLRAERDDLRAAVEGLIAVLDRFPATQCCGTSRDSYRTLWNSMHGPDAWDANPWVVAVSFTVERGNIDKIGRTG